ncbi:MAG: ABC transporter substrate-binding protein [Dehalococcoidia bacterium]|nr:ABC transporter substrate-binding protein [Dehalococcoidia bacterium]
MARVYDRFMRERITRRRLLRAAGGSALGAAGIYVVACGGGGADGDGAPTGVASPAAEGTPRPGGILKLRQTATIPNFNPFGSGIAALIQGLYLGYTVFDHLWFVPTDTGEVINFLATDIETIDPQTVRVSMGEAVFQDIPPVSGRDVRSTDLKASIERFREQVPLGFSWLHEVFERIDAPDNRTVVYHQQRPWAWFFTASNAGSPISSSIIPEEIVRDDEFLNDGAIGSGRWILAGHEAGTNVQFRKFENYREAPLPYLDGVDNVYAPDDTLAQAAFGAQDIDRITGLNRIERDDLESSFGDQISFDTDLSRSYRTLMLKNEPPFDDPDVRHAISLALDRDEIRQVMNLGDGELCGPLPPAHELFVLDENDPDLQEYFRHDPQDARQMLEAAGFPFDQEITLKYSNFETAPDLGELVGKQLRDIGLNINLPGPEDLVAWLANTLGPGNFQMTSFTHLPYEDPSLPLRFYVEPNFMGYKDDDVEQAFRAAAETLDEEERIELTKEAQRVLIRKWAPMINLYSPTSFGATWDYVKGLILGRGSFGLFNTTVWLDK